MSKRIFNLIPSVQLILHLMYIDTVEAASSRTVCVERADPQTSPQECPPAAGERPNQLQDNNRVSLIKSAY